MTVPELIAWLRVLEAAGSKVTVTGPAEAWLPTGPTTVVTVAVHRKPSRLPSGPPPWPETLPPVG